MTLWNSCFQFLGTLGLLLLSCGCERSSPKGEYDLEALYVRFDPTPIKVSRKVTITYGVRNNGSDTVPAMSWMANLYLDHKLVTFDDSTGAVIPGHIAEYKHEFTLPSWSPPTSGLSEFKLVISPGPLKDRPMRKNALEGRIEIVP